MTGEVSFYFLKEDGTTPSTPAPSSGTLTVRQEDGLPPTRGGWTGHPERPPSFPRGGVDGQLSVELDGKSVTIPLGVR